MGAEQVVALDRPVGRLGPIEQVVVDDRPLGSRSGPARHASGRALRFLGTLFLIAGFLGAAWTITVWQWQDPFTALYTRYEQHQLAASLDRQFAAAVPVTRATPASAARDWVASEKQQVASAAALYRRKAHAGQAIGWISVPRLGLHMVLVNGTDHETLKKGPGRDERTFMPGQDRLVYIAGHRTTYLAPFSHIDELRKGDTITLKMPYATFVYRVTGHRIVVATDLSVLRSHGHEVVELQACHPRFFATHRFVVFALPVRVEPRGGRPYAVNV
jgi:sortase A